MPDATPHVAAVFNTSKDIVDMLRVVLQQAGIVAVSLLTTEFREGEANVELFLHEHKPDVIVYDIAPPYDVNWKLFLHISRVPEMKQTPIVLTSTNVERMQELTHTHDRVYEIVGKPYDLDELIRAVKEAIRSRPTK